MDLLAVDPGYATLGWARLDVPSRIVLSTGAYSGTRDKPDASRMDEAIDKVIAEITRARPDAVAVEDYVWQGERSANERAFRVARMIGRVEGAARLAGCRLMTIPRGLVLAHLGLHGRVPKRRVRSLVEALTNYRAHSEHEADAIALGWVAVARLGRVPSLTGHNRNC